MARGIIIQDLENSVLMNYCPLTFIEEVVSQTDFETMHDIFDGVMEEADLDGEPSFDKLFSQMKLMKGGLLKKCITISKLVLVCV